MKRRASALLLAAAVLFLASSAQAAGPAMFAEETTPGGSLRPTGSTAITVLEQHLLLDLRQREGRVQATYQMKNAGDRAEEVAVAFPLPPWVLGEWKVSITLDGRPFPLGQSPRPVTLLEGELELQTSWLDPFNGEQYQPMRLREPVAPQFLIFGVAFDPGQVRQVAVEYLQLPGQETGRLLQPVRRFDYLLQPARHWNGFGVLRLEVLTPVGVPVQSVLPLRAAGPGQYEARLEELPAQNLSIFLAPGSGPRWWWDRNGRIWLLALLALAGGIAAELTALRLQGRWWYAGTWVSLTTWGLLSLVAPPNLLRDDPTGVVFLYVLFIPALMVAHILCRSVVRRVVLALRNRREGANV